MSPDKMLACFIPSWHVLLGEGAISPKPAFSKGQAISCTLNLFSTGDWKLIHVYFHPIRGPLGPGWWDYSCSFTPHSSQAPSSKCLAGKAIYCLLSIQECCIVELDRPEEGTGLLTTILWGFGLILLLQFYNHTLSNQGVRAAANRHAGRKIDAFS